MNSAVSFWEHAQTLDCSIANLLHLINHYRKSLGAVPWYNFWAEINIIYLVRNGFKVFVIFVQWTKTSSVTFSESSDTQFWVTMSSLDQLGRLAGNRVSVLFLFFLMFVYRDIGGAY